MQQQDERLKIVNPAVKSIAIRKNMSWTIEIKQELATKKQLRFALCACSFLTTSNPFNGESKLFQRFDVGLVVAHARCVANKSREHR